MASKLADELLQMILAPSLTIPRDKFISSSTATFGQNDTVSSASALLVCKRWLRVATPLLYETIVIRSTGQSQALADAFRQNRAFAQHVKRIRIEGAYASLEEVLISCSKMETLVILLHIYSDANVKGLCRALPRIDPKEVVLYDECQIDNAKLREAFVMFCKAIPIWENFITFDYPYTGNGCSGIALENRREQLVKALTKSTTIRTISCDIPTILNDPWRRLSRIPSIALKFRFNSNIARHRIIQLELKESLSQVTRASKFSIEFVDIFETAPPPQRRVETRSLKHISRLLKVSSITDKIWTSIFSFAAIPGYPDPPDVFYNALEPYTRLGPVFSCNKTRKQLSLVCKAFERLVRPIFIAFPIIRGPKSLDLFASKVRRQPDLGRQVQVLSVNECLIVDGDMFRHLTCLQHFFLWGKLSCITREAFGLLAETTGSTLKSLAAIQIRGREPLLPHVFNLFKSLMTLDMDSGHFVSVSLPQYSLNSLRELRFGEDTNFYDVISVMSLPQLKFVTFAWVRSPNIENFLEACGSQVEELRFRGFAALGDILKFAPNLRSLRWWPDSYYPKQSITLSNALNDSAAHAKLQKLLLDDIPGSRGGEKEQNATISVLFNNFDLTGFPCLKEIQFMTYDWPIDERAILKDSLPKVAMQIKERHGVNVTDSSGKPWRPRAQKR